MISKSNINNDYIGPRAIFDPDFIPPNLFFRNKEEKSLYSILIDSIKDEFPINILYQGIQGIGKKVIINKVLKDLITNDLETFPFYKISIDCKEKSLEELIFSLLTELNRYSKFNFNFGSILNSKILPASVSFDLLFINNDSEPEMNILMFLYVSYILLSFSLQLSNFCISSRKRINLSFLRFFSQYRLIPPHQTVCL